MAALIRKSQTEFLIRGDPRYANRALTREPTVGGSEYSGKIFHVKS